ncbi:hypothetical protein N2152v2_000910 [Parachlorella kessleri]
MAEQPVAARRTVTTLLLNAAAIVERADEGILPAVYYFIGRSLNATLSQLGTLVLCRALVQALSSPLSGVLGDRYDRTYIVSVGCLLWGVMTAAIGLSMSLGQAMVSCAFNGLGLALVIPCVQSLIADYYPPDCRGNAFGMMGLTASFGGMVGAFYATNVGSQTPFGIEGWRFAFHLIAAISLVTSFLVYKYAVDPRHLAHHPSVHGGSPGGHHHVVVAGKEAAAKDWGQLPPRPPGSLLRDPQVWADIKHVMAIRSFQIVVAQGIVGSTPWQAMVMFTVWLQLLGFSDLEASSLMAIFSLGCAVGGLVGGTLGDWAARRWPNSGRILACQLSEPQGGGGAGGYLQLVVLSGLPLSFLLLKGLPAGGIMGQYTLPYGAVLLLMGLSVSWCGANNSSIFADLVPEQLRSTIYAFDRSFEGAIAACGAPLVGLVAERWFGFEGAVGQGQEGAYRNALALANALLVCLVAPWLLCLLSYTALHWSYPRDRRKSAVGSPGPRRAPSELELGAQALLDSAKVRKRGEGR